MAYNTTTNHKAAKTVAKVAIAGMVVGAPLAAFAGTASAAPATTGNNWDAVAQCESGGNWSTNTGNGFSGGLQFTPSTWAAYGGQGSAQGASKAQQIQVAERVLAGQGAGAWPVCGKSLGASSSSASASSSSQSSNSGSSQQATTKSAPKASSNSSYQAPKSNTSYQAPKATTSYQAPKATTSYQAPKATTSYSAPKSGADYVVQSGDTLAKIAQAQGIQGGYQTLFNLNRDTIQNPNMIYVGQHIALR